MGPKNIHNYIDTYLTYEMCDIDRRKYSGRKHLLRQVFVASIAWVSYFMGGLCLGAPAVFIPQLRREANSHEVISVEMESWLSSAHAFASIAWIFVITYLSNKYGRRYTQMSVCIISFSGFLLFYCSKNPRYILVSEVMLGSNAGSTFTSVLMIASESSSPKYRGIFLTIKTASCYWGIWIANALGTYFHYKYIPMLGMICAVYGTIVTFWSESPYWLASQGRLEESIRKLIWLKGIDENSKMEIKSLSHIQTNLETEGATNLKNNLNHHLTIIKYKEFYKPALLGFCIMVLYYLSGKLACSVYAIQIIKKITHSESTAYKGMLLLDGICVISMYIGSVLSRYLRRRTLLFYSAWSQILCLFTLSCYLYLIRFSIVSEVSFVTISILAGFSVTNSLGITILCTSLFAELMPMKFKSTTMCLSAFASSVVFAITLKMTPFLFSSCGSHGAFLFFACAASISTLILVKYLPETKDKTLQEISNTYINNQQMKEMKELNKVSVTHDM